MNKTIIAIGFAAFLKYFFILAPYSIAIIEIIENGRWWTVFCSSFLSWFFLLAFCGDIGIITFKNGRLIVPSSLTFVRPMQMQHYINVSINDISIVTFGITHETSRGVCIFHASWGDCAEITYINDKKEMIIFNGFTHKQLLKIEELFKKNNPKIKIKHNGLFESKKR